MTNYTLSPMTPDDWPAVREIYLEGIATGQATFETQAPEWEAWDSGHRPDCRLVLKVDDQVVGWAPAAGLRRGGRGQHLPGRRRARSGTG
jgi:phosphinothricin acetyltransferase